MGEKKTMQLHKYSWGEGAEVLLTATIRLLKKSGKGPSVEVWARRRRDEKNEKNVCLHDSGKHGEVNLKVDLDRFCEMYSDATVSIGPNGVQQVKMDPRQLSARLLWQSPLLQCNRYAHHSE